MFCCCSSSNNSSSKAQGHRCLYCELQTDVYSRLQNLNSGAVVYSSGAHGRAACRNFRCCFFSTAVMLKFGAAAVPFPLVILLLETVPLLAIHSWATSSGGDIAGVFFTVAGWLLLYITEVPECAAWVCIACAQYVLGTALIPSPYTSVRFGTNSIPAPDIR